MLTTERKASTIDEYQAPYPPQIEASGYCYFPYQENPQIPTRYGGIHLSGELPTGISCSIRISTEGATVLSATYESNYEQIAFFINRLYTIQEHEQTHPYDEGSDTASAYKSPISTIDIQTEEDTINILDAYQFEEFNTDIAYEFTDVLDRLIRANGKQGILIIDNLIKKRILNDDLISETLRALGRIEDDNTKDERYGLLINSIKNGALIIRDGAVSGLSFLDDKRALPQLQILLKTETVPILKNNIEVAIKGLKEY